MTITSVHPDTERLTLTIETHIEATPDRTWQLWSDPRQLERWWGPPGYPATVTEHDLSPGGRVAYHMTGPDEQRYPGWWRVVEADRPRSLTFEDGFSDEDGRPNADMPTTTTRVIFEQAGGGTRMIITSTFPSLEAMQQLIDMGAVEGMQLALSQIPDILAD